MAKNVENKKLRFLIQIVLTILSAVIMGLGIKIFISPNRFLSTGLTGISLIFGRLYDNIFKPVTSKETLITSILYFVFNIPILILGGKKISPRFSFLSAINVIVTSLTLAILPDDLCETLNVSVANGDITFLDAALFVGIMNGAANAFSYIVGGSTGGIDVISMYFSSKKQVAVGKIMTSFNIVVLLLGMLVDNEGKALSKAFYTFIYLVLASTVIDLFYVRNKRNILLITTEKGEEISKEINYKFLRGVTKLDAKGAYTGDHKDFLYCACSTFEVETIIAKIKSIDEHAFITVIEAKKVLGNFMNKDLQ